MKINCLLTKGFFLRFDHCTRVRARTRPAEQERERETISKMLIVVVVFVVVLDDIQEIYFIIFLKKELFLFFTLYGFWICVWRFLREINFIQLNALP